MAIINGTGGNDTLNGTSSSDQIFGFGGDDTLNGNGGNDTLDGGSGADTMSGGTGNDTYIVDDVGDSVIELSGQGTDTVRTTLTAYLLDANVEKLRFIGSGNFTGTGNELSNEIEGGASSDDLFGEDGYDYLLGRGGDDNLYGGADGDTLDGGSGGDHMEGGTGDDAYIVDDLGDVVLEFSGEGTDQVYTSLSDYVIPDEVENMTYNGVSGDAFTGTGNTLDNVIYGGGGADSLSGAEGNDELRGQGGSDTLDGGDGDDLLVGGGGIGQDTMTGGIGADRFQIGYYESNVGASGDIITDFESGTDLIDLSGWDANINTAGNQAFSFVGTAAFSNTAGELRYYFDGTNTWVQGDINGDSVADFDIMLSGSVTPVATDFVL